MKNKPSFSDFWNFFISYVITEAISFAAMAIPLLVTAPVLAGTLYDVQDSYADAHNGDYAGGPVSVALNIYVTIAFFIVFGMLYLYRNKERRLMMQKHSTENFSLIQEAVCSFKTYGLFDLLYDCISYIPFAFWVVGGMEGQIFVPILDPYASGFIRYLSGVPVFVIGCTADLLIVLTIWNKKRPAYLTKGYTEKAD